jgi:hypothetical protein
VSENISSTLNTVTSADTALDADTLGITYITDRIISSVSSLFVACLFLILF